MFLNIAPRPHPYLYAVVITTWLSLEGKLTYPAGNKITLQQSCKRFNQDLYVMNVKNEKWLEKGSRNCLKYVHGQTNNTDKPNPLKGIPMNA